MDKSIHFPRFLLWFLAWYILIFRQTHKTYRSYSTIVAECCWCPGSWDRHHWQLACHFLRSHHCSCCRLYNRRTEDDRWHGAIHRVWTWFSDVLCRLNVMKHHQLSIFQAQSSSSSNNYISIVCWSDHCVLLDRDLTIHPLSDQRRQAALDTSPSEEMTWRPPVVGGIQKPAACIRVIHNIIYICIICMFDYVYSIYIYYIIIYSIYIYYMVYVLYIRQEDNVSLWYSP